MRAISKNSPTDKRVAGVSECSDWWAGEWGELYTARNRVDWRARIPFWRHILDLTGARSVHEFGTNCGWNLSAIRRIAPDVMVHGNEINAVALQQAWNAGLDFVSAARPEPNCCELSFTAGCLIHIPPDELGVVMQDLIFAATDYVLCVEYEDEQETEVEYRGNAGKLWRRPYRKLYEGMGLKLVAASGNAEGFDRCQWSLHRK